MQVERKVFYMTRKWKLLFLFLLLSITPLTIPPAVFVVAALWMTFRLSFVLAIVIGIVVFLLEVSPLYLIIDSARCIVTSQGIAFYFLTYRISTPWSNVRGIGTAKFNRSRPPGLVLWQPAIEGKVGEPIQLDQAVVQRWRWLTTAENPSYDVLPLIFVTSGKNWQESELGASIRRYAPHIFHNTTEEQSGTSER